ncbi:MAG: NUDIX hydrolase [bacterium]|nr:NUDIX hydrolase [bacterium]
MDVCDHTSVGVIARDNQGKILMIERKMFPFGFAPPAGHCDGDQYPVACCKEFRQETGLEVVGAPKPLILIKNARTPNMCRRGGLYHFWQVFEVKWKGERQRSLDETKWIGWMSVEEIRILAAKTQEYLQRLKLAEQAEEKSWAVSIKKSVENQWQKSPGLEIVWFDIFQELRII